MANQAIHYVRWVFIHRFVGRHDVKDVFVITKSIQTTRIELGMRALLEKVPLMAVLHTEAPYMNLLHTEITSIAIHGTLGLGRVSKKVDLWT